MSHNNVDRAIDPRMFGKDWWLQPLEARYASINARDAGLLVQIELMKRSPYGDMAPCITWRGNSTQFMATRYFSKGVAVKRSSGRWYTPGALRGHVYPDGDDCFVYVIEWCCSYSTLHGRAKRVQQALQDDNYRRFRDVLVSNDASLLADDMGGLQ